MSAAAPSNDAIPTPPPNQGHGLAWTTSAYFGEGLPFSVLHQLMTEYLTSIGAPPSQVAATSWLHIPVTAKPLWSPLIDLVLTKRTWTASLQMLFGAGLAGLAAWLHLTAAQSGAPSNWVVFWLVLGFLAVTHAMHDIACDGFYMIALDAHGQALYSGTRQAAYRAAMYVGGALLVLLASPTRELGIFGAAGSSHWPLAIGVASALMLSVGLLNAWLLPHVDEAAVIKREGGKQPFWAPYRTFFQQPHVALVLAFTLTYRLGDTMTSTMSSVLLREQGFTLDDRALIRSISLTVTIGGSVIAGYLLSRGGLEKWFRPFTWVMAIPWYLVVAIVHPPLWGVAICVVLEQLCGALAGTAATVFLMRRCRRAFSASHYAFFTALVSLGSTISGAFSGYLYEAVTPIPYFVLTLVASVPALVLVRQMQTTSLHSTEA